MGDELHERLFCQCRTVQAASKDLIELTLNVLGAVGSLGLEDVSLLALVPAGFTSTVPVSASL